jgi:hypothetical protein
VSRNRTITAFVFASISFTIPHPLHAQTLVCPDKLWANVSTDPVYPSLHDIHGVSSQSVFVVGAGGTILHFNGTDWTPMASGTQVDLVGVWAESDNDVYAVGRSILLHHDGISWGELSGPISAHACDVIVSGGSVYIAAGGAVQELAGGTWSTTTFPCESGDWYDVCDNIVSLTPHPQGGWYGVGKRAIWYDFVDEKYGLLYANGVYVAHDPTPGEFTDAWASADELYIVHRPIYSSGNEIYYTSGGTTLAPMPEQPALSVMNIFGDTYPFGVAGDGRLTWYDGASWLETSQSAGVGYGEVWGTSPGDVYGLGGTYIYRYDGAGFAVYGDEGGPGSFPLVDAWVDENQDVWAVGNTELYRYDGAQWRSEATVPGKINAMWGRASNDIYLVDDGGNVVRYDGAGQTTVSLDADRLWDITESRAGDMYAVGEKGVGRVFRFDGSAWTLFQDNLSAACTAVLFTQQGGYPDYLVVGTSEGDVYRYAGGWRHFANVFYPDDPVRILDLWGISHDQVLAAGDGPLIANINLRLQSVVTVYDTPTKVFRLWGRSTNDVWGAGNNGSVLHFDGSTWFPDASTGVTQFGVAGAGPCDVYLVGDGGNVWHLEPPGPGTTVYTKVDGYPWRLVPGEQICAHAWPDPRRHSITTLFDVRGTNWRSDVVVTDASGQADYCYLPDRPGVDTVTASVQIGPGEYATYTRVVSSTAQGFYFDPQGYTNGETVRIIPPAEVCASFLYGRTETGVNVDFTVSGANPASGSVATDYNGRVACCYTASSTGVDTIVVTVTHQFPAGPVTASRSVYINLALPEVQVSFDEQFEDGTDSVRTVQGGDVCVRLRTDPPWKNAQIGLTVDGANATSGTATTDYLGHATWCYPVQSYGVDTVRVLDATLVMNVLPPFVSLESSTGDTALTVAPGDNVCSTIETDPEWSGAEVQMRVHGANAIIDTVTTVGPGGNATWCYAPTDLGVDTLTAVVGDVTAAETDVLVLSLQQPQIAVDPSYEPGVNEVLAAPGGELCAPFVLDHEVTSQRFDFTVTGTNTQTHADWFTGNSVQYCYTAGSLGADTISVKADFDYGEGIYTSIDTLILFSYAPEFTVDSTYQVSFDTMLTYVDGTLCAHFVTTPPLERVIVTCHVTGANTAEVTNWSDELGRVHVCYPAPNEGLDSLSATAHFVISGTPYETTESLVVYALEGGSVRPVVTMTSSPAGPGDYHVDFDVRCNKELANPRATFEFERSDGFQTEYAGDFVYVAGTEWTYRNSYWVEADGRVEVWFLAEDLFGNLAQSRTGFEVGRVVWNETLDYRSNDGTVRLSSPFGAVQRSGALSIRGEAVGDPTPSDEVGHPLEPVSDAYTVATSAQMMTSPSLTSRHGYRAGAVPSPDDDPRKVGIYRLDGNHWKYVGGSGQEHTVSAAVQLPGTFAAFYNEAVNVIPRKTVLFQNYPNPFNPQTTIAFDLHTDGDVELVVYNVEGKQVRTLWKGPRAAGAYEIQWDGRDDAGNLVATGVYLYRLRTPASNHTRKMVLLK